MLGVRLNAQATLDPKGRLALPAPVKRALADAAVDRLVLSHTDGAIWAWTAEDFRVKVEERYKDHDPFDKDVLTFQHAVVSTSEDVEVDGAGRIRVPPLLRSLAGLEKDVRVISMLGRLELWDPRAWELRYAEARREHAARPSGRPA